MDESLDDLKRRFIQRAASAKPVDSKPIESKPVESKLGFELWCLLVTHPWFTTQLHHRVFHLVRRWGGNREDVEEIKQDVVIQLRLDMRDKPTLGLDLKRSDKFRAWVNRIIHNISVELAESRFGRRLPIEQAAEPDQAAVAFHAFEEVDLRFILLRLPEPDRTAAMLRIERRELKEIAREMQLTVDQVRTILSRARRRLGRLLEDR